MSLKSYLLLVGQQRSLHVLKQGHLARASNMLRAYTPGASFKDVIGMREIVHLLVFVIRQLTRSVRQHRARTTPFQKAYPPHALAVPTARPTAVWPFV